MRRATRTNGCRSTGWSAASNRMGRQRPLVVSFGPQSQLKEYWAFRTYTRCGSRATRRRPCRRCNARDRAVGESNVTSRTFLPLRRNRFTLNRCPMNMFSVRPTCLPLILTSAYVSRPSATNSTLRDAGTGSGSSNSRRYVQRWRSIHWTVFSFIPTNGSSIFPFARRS